METNVLNKISLNISNIFHKDYNDEPIYSGDILISAGHKSIDINNNFQILYNLIKFKIGSKATDKLICDIYNFLKSLKFQFKLINFNISENEIVTSEYFLFKNQYKPFLFFHGLYETFNFNYAMLDNKIMNIKNYIHLTEPYINELNLGLTVIHKDFGQKIEDRIKYLNSIFGKNYKIIRLWNLNKTKNICLIFFTYKIKDMIQYKKAKKYQKGVLQRLNWYKSSVTFPILSICLNEKNIFEEALNINKYKRMTFNKLLYNYFDILYAIENRYEKNKSLNHKLLSIFCSKSINSNKKIYFFKGKLV